MWGPKLAGPHKWLGGAVTQDGAFLLGVPSNSDSIVRLRLDNGEVDLIEATGSYRESGRPTRWKWLRGVRARDGSVFCIPACADCVLRIWPDGHTDELGHGELPRGEWKWHGGQLGRDGNIYAIPANADRVLKIEPGSGRISLIGPDLQPGVRNKWYGGIVAHDGSIWGMPFNASSVLKVVPETCEVREIGDFGKGGWKWHGGARSGDYIIGVPSHAKRVLRVSPESDQVDLIGGEHEGLYKWGGAAVDASGAVWAIPSDARCTLRIDPPSGEVLAVGENMSPWRNKWQNAVLARDGDIYCIPCDAPQVLVIHTATRSLSLLGNLPLQPKKFQGGALAADGTIWCLPECGENILRIEPRDPLVPVQEESSLEPVSQEHWDAWERAWEGAGKLYGAGRAKMDLSDALAAAALAAGQGHGAVNGAWAQADGKCGQKHKAERDCQCVIA